MIVLVVSAKLGLLPVWFGPCLPVVDPSGTDQLSLHNLHVLQDFLYLLEVIFLSFYLIFVV